MPVLILQWALGGQYLIKNSKIFLLTFIIPTIYLWCADAIAIYLEVWQISTVYTTGINLGVLPIEEACFFLVTNLMVAQGLVLFIVMEKEVAAFLKFKRSILTWKN